MFRPVSECNPHRLWAEAKRLQNTEAGLQTGASPATVVRCMTRR